MSWAYGRVHARRHVRPHVHEQFDRRTAVHGRRRSRVITSYVTGSKSRHGVEPGANFALSRVYLIMNPSLHGDGPDIRQLRYRQYDHPHRRELGDRRLRCGRDDRDDRQQ